MLLVRYLKNTLNAQNLLLQLKTKQFTPIFCNLGGSGLIPESYSNLVSINFKNIFPISYTFAIFFIILTKI